MDSVRQLASFLALPYADASRHPEDVKVKTCQACHLHTPRGWCTRALSDREGYLVFTAAPDRFATSPWSAFTALR
jgi:hypothetical protein